VEQTHKKLELWQRGDRARSSRSVMIAAMQEVSGPSFFALLVIAVSFLPVFALEGEEGRLFKPLALTKCAAMMVAALLTITLDPAIRLLFTRTQGFQGRPRWVARLATTCLASPILREDEHPISGFLIRLYQPVAAWTLRWKWVVFLACFALVLTTIPVYRSLGSEFMPPLDEGALLFMPTTVPGISATEARRVLQLQDRLLRSVPEVDRVFGKAGRAETATDPAPLSMFETVVLLKPKDQWRKVKTWYSDFPDWTKPALRHLRSDAISLEDLTRALDQSVRLPGVSNSWTMPIKNRIDMQTTGIRTALGVKVFGPDVKVIERISHQIEGVLGSVRGTRSVFAERLGGGHYLNVDLKRDQLARYGLTVDDAEAVIGNGIGGENITTILDGRARYPVSVRYLSAFRSDPEWFGRALVTNDRGTGVPLSALADIRIEDGPSMLRTENGQLEGYVYVDVANRDLGSYVVEAQKLVRAGVIVPEGYSLSWSGQYEAMERVRERLWVVVPFTVALIFILLYLNTKSVAKALLVMLAAPFSAIGAFWLLYLLGYNLSVGVWIGLIALLGVDAETGVFMLLYIDLAVAEARSSGRLHGSAALRDAILDGAVKRIRPKFRTAATILLGLLPIMWSTGAGSDVMKRIAAPMLGGITSSFLLELIVYPALYEILLRRSVSVGAPEPALR
ncbi:MAG: heavy metal efflux pump, CzcA family, partial [Bryobacterales bacterium]|nr:heavy metal efflux pump, CzcA family [Bryobacterales bacterium]